MNTKTEIKTKETNLTQKEGCNKCRGKLDRITNLCESIQKNINTHPDYCKICGNLLKKNANFCHTCGSPSTNQKRSVS